MHGIDFHYVVMRNFEHLPDGIFVKGHGDLDLLVYDLKHFEELFPDIKPTFPKPRVQYKANVGGLNVYLDVRSVGDGYYPTDFQLNMLDSREYNPKGFFTPNPVFHRIGLAYHVAHHRNHNSYKNWLGEATVEELADALKESDVGYSIPDDHTVGTYNQYWKGATSVVSKDGDKVFKKQTGYNGYNLIDNEHRILSTVDSKHFPKVEKEDDGISIEDCGERIRVENLPEDWEEQFIDILRDLKRFNIQHRDIKPDNIMVKDNIVKLIDFGWSRFKDDKKDSPPQCLGYPYSPSWGWDDNFSMTKVIKEFKFKKEKILI